MKTILASTLAAAGIVLSITSAFALSNSPEGRVVTGTEVPAITAPQHHENAAPRYFLSGSQQDDSAFLSSNAVQGREFLNVQKGRY